MDFRQKLKSLIGRQESLTSPVDENISSESFKQEPAVAKFKPEHRSNPLEDQELVAAIEKAYYNDETFDTSHYELEKLPEVVDLSKVDDDRIRLRKQLQAVSKKVSELILQKQPAYATELQRVMELQKTLQLAGVICSTGRKQLSHARESFTTTSLGLLSNYRKRQQLLGLLKSLHTIKTLQRTDLRLREMMEEEDYCGAIQLCLECQKAASTFRHYKCISELSSKLQDTLEMIEEQLDVALSKTCAGFDVTHYEKVQTAYRILGKTQTAMDQLHMHFASAIHNTAFTMVLGYVELASGTGNAQNFQKRQYSDLCKHITMETFTPCLVDLCKALWGVMKSYYRTMHWHENYDHHNNAQNTGETSSSSSSSVEATFTRRYVMQKLEYGRGRVWQDVQQKVKTFILATDLSVFKLEEFIKVLDIINRMIEIGEEFCGSKSEGLQDSLKQQSLNYFYNHHRARLDELRVFLENEGWELCPVKSNFNILHLLEFRFLRNWKPKPSETSTDSEATSENIPNSTLSSTGYFARFQDDLTPFDLQQDDEEQEDVFSSVGESKEDGYGDSDSDSDVPDELKQDYIDELTGETRSYRYSRQRSHSNRGKKHKHTPLVTNTTLNVLRVIGKYLQMMSVLKPIAFDVITCTSKLFDYIFYTVYTFFGSDSDISMDRTVNNRLRTTLHRIHDNMIAGTGTSSGIEGDQDDNKDRVLRASMSPIVDLHSPHKLYGLSERVVATESLVFLAEQLEQIQSFLESMIPPTKKAFLQQFFSQTVKMSPELRKPVYKAVARQAVDYEFVLQQMSNVRWDVKDIMSQHNNYVDHLLASLVGFNNRLLEVERHVPIPKVAVDLVWEHCVRLCNRTFVDGYANAKKCSNEGRALMQLDFQQFVTRLDKIIEIKPIPEREFVETYIKAYYLPESQLETWLQDHKEYSNKQLLSLIGSVDHISKKARQRLTNVVEDMERVRR